MTRKSYINRAHLLIIAHARRELGERCFHALLKAKPESKAAVARTALPHRRTSMTVKVLVETALKLVAALKLARQAKSSRFEKIKVNRQDSVFFRAASLGNKATALPWSATTYLLPAGTPHQRLSARRRKIEEDRITCIRKSLKGFLGCVRTEEQTVRRLPSSANFSKVTGKAWGETIMVRYPSRHSYPKRFASFSVAIPHDYETSVVAAGLQLLGGMFTLIAQPQSSDRSGEQVWKAKWLRKGRGFHFIVHNGYIVRTGKDYAHGETVSAARNVLARRDAEQKFRQRETALRHLLESGAHGVLGATPVSIADSLAAGNCESGTLAFRDAHFPGKEAATIQDILSADTDREIRRLTIAACLHAIRREARRRPEIRASYLQACASEPTAV